MIMVSRDQLFCDKSFAKITMGIKMRVYFQMSWKSNLTWSIYYLLPENYRKRANFMISWLVANSLKYRKILYFIKYVNFKTFLRILKSLDNENDSIKLASIDELTVDKKIVKDFTFIHISMSWLITWKKKMKYPICFKFKAEKSNNQFPIEFADFLNCGQGHFTFFKRIDQVKV